MELEFQIGDSFRIVGKTKKPCRYKDKVFVVSKISKGGIYIYYEDYRTSMKCNCRFCSTDKYLSIIDNKVHEHDKNRQIHVDEIELVDNKIQRERNLKLKIILNERR